MTEHNASSSIALIRGYCANTFPDEIITKRVILRISTAKDHQNIYFKNSSSERGRFLSLSLSLCGRCVVCVDVVFVDVCECDVVVLSLCCVVWCARGVLVVWS